MFGAILTSLVFQISELHGVTNPVSTTQPLLFVMPSTVVGADDSTGTKVALAVTPWTSWTPPLVTSTSSAEPIGGVITLTSLRGNRLADCSSAQLTDEVIWMLAPFSALDSVALQPVPVPLEFSGCASWVIV